MAPKRKATPKAKAKAATQTETETLHGSSASGSRKLKRESTDQVVNQRIRDNFKDWGPEDTDLFKVNGVSLREELTADVRKERLAGRFQFTPGKFYYQTKRKIFRRDLDPDDLLKQLIPDDEEIDADWLKAVIKARKVPPDRTLLLSKLRSVATMPSLTTVVAIVRWAITLNPRNKKMAPAGLDVLRFLAKHDVKTERPAIFDIVRPWVDTLLTLTWLKSKQLRMSQASFLEIYDNVTSLLLPKKAVDKVLANLSELQSVAPELSLICVGSNLANAMFGGALMKVSGFEVERIIDVRIKAFASKTDIIDDAKCATFLDALMLELQGMPQCKALPNKRDIKFEYRGQKFAACAKSLASEVQLKTAAYWKGIAVDRGILPPLWIEELLTFQTGLFDTGPTVAASLCVPAKFARAECKKAADEYQAIDPNVLKELLDLKSTHFLSIDRDFAVELELIRAIIGQNSGEKLFKMVVDTFPTATTAKSPEHVLVQIDKIMSQELYKFASSDAKAKIEVAQKMVSKLLDGREPDVDVAKTDDFLKHVVSHVQFFIRVELPGSADLPGQTLIGLQAAQHLLADVVSKQSDGSIVPGDLATVLTFRYLLDAQDQIALDLIASSTQTATLTTAKRRRTDDNTKSKKLANSGDKAMEDGLNFFKK